MRDLVLAENLPCARGIAANAAASALKSFRQPKGDAKAEARAKNCLLYVQSYEFDEGACRELARSGGALVFSFSDVLREKGFRRGIILSKMRLALAACRKADCGYVACTLARSADETRNARELAAFMAVLGMDARERKFAEETAERLFGSEVGK